jgi:hypothetical protein
LPHFATVCHILAFQPVKLYLLFREQRLTRTLAFVMIGISILLTPVLCHIPLPVLYGVFLYMGVNVLKGEYSKLGFFGLGYIKYG